MTREQEAVRDKRMAAQARAFAARVVPLESDHPTAEETLTRTMMEIAFRRMAQRDLEPRPVWRRYRRKAAKHA